MASLARVLLCLGTWIAATSAFSFTNSFDGWTTNSTYNISWKSSSSDPAIYNLVLVRPHGINETGISLDGTWPRDWAVNAATQIPSFGDQFIMFTVPPDCQPGYYYWVIETDNSTPVSPTFFIARHNDTEGAVTVSTFIPVTATQSVVGISDGQLVTFKPSDVFSSVVVYTTIIVNPGEGKGAPKSKVNTIAGATIGALFLISMPIVVWLILRYRRRPVKYASPDKPHSAIGPEHRNNPSVPDLLVPYTVTAAHNLATSTEANGRACRNFNGEKHQSTISRHSLPITPSAESKDPFADPITHSHSQSGPRIMGPQMMSDSHNSAISSSTPIEAPTTRGNITTEHHPDRFMHLCNELDVEAQTNGALSGGKANVLERSRSAQVTQPLLPEEVAARMIVPGRAVDMGPLGRDRFGEVDENGLLPPDYVQATQPIRSPPGSTCN